MYQERLSLANTLANHRQLIIHRAASFIAKNHQVFTGNWVHTHNLVNNHAANQEPPWAVEIPRSAGHPGTI